MISYFVNGKSLWKNHKHPFFTACDEILSFCGKEIICRKTIVSRDSPTQFGIRIQNRKVQIKQNKLSLDEICRCWDEFR